MGQQWLYYVPFVMQKGDGKISFGARIYPSDSALNEPEKVWTMIDTITAQHVTKLPEGNELPIIPLGWTLISAQRGPAVKSRKKRPAPGDNGSGPTTVGEPSSQ